MINFDGLHISVNEDNVTDGLISSIQNNVDSQADVQIDSVVLNPIMTGLINDLTANGAGVIEIDNGCFTHLSGSFGRTSFDSRDIFANDSQEDELNVFSHRTRVKISKVHVLATHTLEVESIRDYDLSHPIVSRTLANDNYRETVLNFLGQVDMVNALSRMLTGGTNRADIGTKRYTFTRLLNWVRNRGLIDSDKNVPLVITIILNSILNQFDWRFETITPAHIHELRSRLAHEDELRDLYVEGWISKVVPNEAAWIMKYSGSTKVTSAALEECIEASILKLRRNLMQVSLLNNRSADVMAAAKIAAAMNLGLIETIPNETLLAFINSSPVISEMAEWYSIVDGVINEGFTADFQLSTHVGDVGLLTMFANEFVDSINNNALVKVYDVGSFLKHITIKHYNTEGLSGNARYHTGIFGNLDSTLAPRHYVESQLANNIYGVDIIRENNSFNDDIKRSVSTCYDAATNFLCERDAVVTYGTISSFVDPEDVITAGRHGFTLSGVCARDIRLLALVSSEMLIRYTRVVDAEEGTNSLTVLSAAYVINNVSTSAANPLPSFEDQVYTTSVVIACCFNITERLGSGFSPLLEVVVGLDKIDFLFNSLESSLGTIHSRTLPQALSISLNLPDSRGNTVSALSTIDLRRYLVMSSIDDTYALVPHSTIAQLSVVDYALNLASAAVTFRGSNSQYAYDMERINANYLAKVYDTAATNSILRNMSTNVRHDVARTLSGTTGSFTSAYNNVELRVHTTLTCAMIPFILYLGGLNVNTGIAIVNTGGAMVTAYDNNRLFRDAILAKVVGR